VFGGTLNLAQSIHHSILWVRSSSLSLNTFRQQLKAYISISDEQRLALVWRFRRHLQNVFTYVIRRQQVISANLLTVLQCM